MDNMPQTTDVQLQCLTRYSSNLMEQTLRLWSFLPNTSCCLSCPIPKP